MQSIIEYNINRIKEPLGEIDDMLVGPCCNDDRDEPSEFKGRGELAEAERVDRQIETAHDGEIERFLEACPHLDSVRAFELLSKLPIAGAIKKGLEIVMTPKEHVPAWIQQQMGDPTDLKFTADNAFIDKMETDRKKLGDKFVEPPTLRIKEIVQGQTAAEDPQQVGLAYTKVVWSDPIMAARFRAARLEARQKRKCSPGLSYCQVKRAKR